jgi:hypothetical protein
VNTASSEPTTNRVSQAGAPAPLPPVSPNYQFFGPDGVRQASGRVVGQVLTYLRGLDPRRTALVLTQVGLSAIAGILAWPSGTEHTGYRVLGAFGVSLILAATGLVAFLTERGKTNAADTQDSADKPADAGPSGAGPEAA